jgi:NADPH:quinone reductase-like Zn-dependent oxidoreductase
MLAVRYHSFGRSDTVGADDISIPEPGPDEVRIRVAGATVNRTDLKARAGVYEFPDPDSAGYGLGMDVSGVIDRVGERVTDPQVGDEVIALSENPVENGMQAEYVTVPSSWVVNAPSTVELARAAVLPLNGLTAVQAIDKLPRGAATTVVVTGAAGGLGTMLVQLARIAGHTVIAWVRSEDDAPELMQLGAARVITAANQIDPRSADAVIDAASLGDAAVELLRDGGSFLTLGQTIPTAGRQIELVAVLIRHDPSSLAKLVDMVDRGELKLPDIVQIPFNEVARAHDLFDAGVVRDRLVLVPVHFAEKTR